MKLEDLFEGEVVNFQNYKRKKNKPDAEKYQDAVDKQQGTSIDTDTFKLDDVDDEIIMKFFNDLMDTEDEMYESAKMAWARRGNKVVRKYRCTTGRRKGRIVSNPTQCSKAIDMKKRLQLRKTKARKGSRMARKAKRTKRMNPASKRLKTLNKRR